MIFVAMLQDAAETLIQLPGYEVDMTFKGVASEMNEFELVYYHPAYSMTLTFARVFTNVKDADGYEIIFDTIEEVIKQLTGNLPTWHHIHNAGGWAYVVADFDPAQAIGLGQHLHKLDKTCTPVKHLQQVLITCITHFKRNIVARKFPEEIRNLFWLILTLRNKIAVNETITRLKNFHLKTIDDLLHFYKQPWVLSSLSPAYTQVPQEVFNQINRMTNAGESAHANANRMGKGNSLLGAIYKYV